MQVDRKRWVAVCFTAVAVLLVHAPQEMSAQADAKLVGSWLQRRLQSEPLVAEQLRRFMQARVPPLRLPADAARWTAETERLRARELQVIYHGWPQNWIDAPPKFEEVGAVEGHGYRIHKLRYEVVPGMYSAALLYEPEHVSWRRQYLLPTIVNLETSKGTPTFFAIE